MFDTQIAAALTGMPAQIGYGELVRRMLGVELAKSHTRTDWSRRPLSAEQIEYALDDVRYLVPLKARLEEQLEQLGRHDVARGGARGARERREPSRRSGRRRGCG